MESDVSRTCTFIVKFWIEEFDEEKNISKWRGHITNALNGERKYFEDKATVLNFVSPYLSAIGIDVEKGLAQKSL